jgi:hypothetical protein
MRDHRAEVLAQLAVVRHAAAVLAAHGVVENGPAATALALVERWGADGGVDIAALGAAARAAWDDGAADRLTAEPARRALLWLKTGAGNLCAMAQKGRGWQNTPRTILDAATYAISSLRVPGLPERHALEQLAKDALASVPPAPTRKKTPGLPRLKKLGETPELGDVASAWWQKQKPRRDPRLMANQATLTALLQGRGLPAPGAVLDVEARYGGTRFTEPGGAEGVDVILGPYALLVEDAATPGRERGLVPVALTPNDVWYFVDDAGAMWAWDTIEEPEPVLFATSTTVGIARFILFSRAFSERARLGGVDVEGRHGAALAQRLNLPPIEEASDDLARFWGDARTLVFELALDVLPAGPGSAPPPPENITTVIGRAAKALTYPAPLPPRA